MHLNPYRRYLPLVFIYRTKTADERGQPAEISRLIITMLECVVSDRKVEPHTLWAQSERRLALRSTFPALRSPAYYRRFLGQLRWRRRSCRHTRPPLSGSPTNFVGPTSEKRFSEVCWTIDSNLLQLASQTAFNGYPAALQR